MVQLTSSLSILLGAAGAATLSTVAALPAGQSHGHPSHAPSYNGTDLVKVNVTAPPLDVKAIVARNADLEGRGKSHKHPKHGKKGKQSKHSKRHGSEQSADEKREWIGKIGRRGPSRMAPPVENDLVNVDLSNGPHDHHGDSIDIEGRDPHHGHGHHHHHHHHHHDRSRHTEEEAKPLVKAEVDIPGNGPLKRDPRHHHHDDVNVHVHKHIHRDTEKRVFPTGDVMVEPGHEQVNEDARERDLEARHDHDHWRHRPIVVVDDGRRHHRHHLTVIEARDPRHGHSDHHHHHHHHHHHERSEQSDCDGMEESEVDSTGSSLVTKRGVEGSPGYVDVTSPTFNSSHPNIIASLVLSTDNGTDSNSTFVLNASTNMKTQMYLVPLDTSAPESGEIQVHLELPMFVAASAMTEDYCATFDRAPSSPAPLTVTPCKNATAVEDPHSSQVFLYDPDTGVISPQWQPADAAQEVQSASTDLAGGDETVQDDEMPQDDAQDDTQDDAQDDGQDDASNEGDDDDTGAIGDQGDDADGNSDDADPAVSASASASPSVTESMSWSDIVSATISAADYASSSASMAGYPVVTPTSSTDMASSIAPSASDSSEPLMAKAFEPSASASAPSGSLAPSASSSSLSSPPPLQTAGAESSTDSKSYENDQSSNVTLIFNPSSPSETSDHSEGTESVGAMALDPYPEGDATRSSQPSSSSTVASASESGSSASATVAMVTSSSTWIDHSPTPETTISSTSSSSASESAPSAPVVSADPASMQMTKRSYPPVIQRDVVKRDQYVVPGERGMVPLGSKAQLPFNIRENPYTAPYTWKWTRA